MKETLIQLLVCPGVDEGHTVCDGCPCRGKYDCFKALKTEAINKLQYGVVVNKPFNIELRISEALREIGVPAHVKGFRSLREAIKILVNNENLVDYVTSDIYPQVAETLGTTPTRVERTIRHAIESAWDRGDLEVLQKWFGNTVSPSRGKPTNSEFIATVSDIIRMEVQQSG